MGTGRRVVEVAPARLDAYLAELAAGDGAEVVGGLERFDHDPFGLVLIRRGGYGVGLAVGGRLADSKVGTRHVQSRTAAGGWSQQRFARRRAGQADALVEAVAGHAARILLGKDGPAMGRPARQDAVPAGLVVGGDRAMVAAVLAEPGMTRLASLPTRTLYDLPDPTRKVLERAVWRGRAVRVTLVPARDSGSSTGSG